MPTLNENSQLASNADEEKILDALSALPQHIKDWIGSDAAVNININLNKVHGFQKEKRRVIPRSTALLLIKQLPPEKFLDHLMDNLDIDVNTAKLIAKEINERVFGPIRGQIASVLGINLDLILKESTAGVPAATTAPAFHETGQTPFILHQESQPAVASKIMPPPSPPPAKPTMPPAPTKTETKKEELMLPPGDVHAYRQAGHEKDPSTGSGQREKRIAPPLPPTIKKEEPRAVEPTPLEIDHPRVAEATPTKSEGGSLTGHKPKNATIILRRAVPKITPEIKTKTILEPEIKIEALRQTQDKESPKPANPEAKMKTVNYSGFSTPVKPAEPKKSEGGGNYTVDLRKITKPDPGTVDLRKK